MVVLSACKQELKKDTSPKNPSGVSSQSSTPITQAAANGGATGDAAVDSMGTGLNTVSNDESDMDTDKLGDVDSGIDDAQNI